MSIVSEILRIKQNFANAYDALRNYNVTVPTNVKSDNLSNLINSIKINRYYEGNGVPSNSFGNDGDLYLQL